MQGKTNSNLVPVVQRVNKCRTLDKSLGGGGMQGWPITCLQQCGPGLIPRSSVMWVEFVGSRLCTARFSPGTPVFPLLKKPAFDLICVNC